MSIFKTNYAIRLSENSELQEKEYSFIYSLIDYNRYNEYLKLSEKQKSWYISICIKYCNEEILKGSVGDRMLKNHRQPISEKMMNHIKTYGNIFNLNENIIKQLTK